MIWFLLGFAVVMGPTVYWLADFSTRRDAGNGWAPPGWRSRDSTVGGYARQAKEFAQELDRQVEEAQATHTATATGLPIEERKTAEYTGVGEA